jgi:hypothetical protein
MKEKVIQQLDFKQPILIIKVPEILHLVIGHFMEPLFLIQAVQEM